MTDTTHLGNACPSGARESRAEIPGDVSTSELRPLRIAIMGGPDARDALLSRGDGGRKIDAGIRELVHRVHREVYSVDSRYDRGQPCASLLHNLRLAQSDASASPGDLREFLEFGPDVVVLSIASDLHSEYRKFEQAMPEIVRILQDNVGAHVIFLNGSSVNPTRRGPRRVFNPVELHINRLNLILINLSRLLGVSIIDVDRIVAERGARENVLGVLDYSEEVCEAIGQELLRVLTDDGYFDERPIVPQLGLERIPA